MPKKCIDLEEKAGKQYRVTYEESYYAQYGPNARAADSWLMIIPCRHGHIFPWGGNRLAAASKSKGPTANTLRTLPGVEVAQDGSDGVTIVFNVSQFDQVAEIMQPKRKRQLSEEAKAAAAQRLAKFQWKAGNAPNSKQAHAVETRQESAVFVPLG